MPSSATRPAAGDQGTDAPIEPIQLKNFEGPVLAAEELAAIAKHKHVPIPSDADGGKRPHSAVPYIVVGLLLVTMAYVAVKYGVGHVPNYTPYFLGFAAFFFVMERLAPLFSNAVSASYRSSNEHVKRNWDIRIVAVVHAIVSSYGAYLVLASGLLDHDKLFGENFNCSMLYCFTFGYFIWDLVCCCRHYELFGPGFLAHAICCTILFSNMMRPYCQYYGSVFILYELSTPFVNFHWFFDKTGMSGHWLQIANGVITIGLFVFVRIGYGFYQSYFFFAETLSMLRDRSSPAAQDPFFPIEAAIYLTANVILNSLNVVWLRAMVLSVLSRTGGKSKKTSKAN